MGSINAAAVAWKVSEAIRNGKKVSVSKLMREQGYTTATSKRVHVTKTKAWKSATKPLIDGIQQEINEIKAAMAAKDKTQEDYRVLAGTLDILVRNYQLLSGGATERNVLVLPAEVIGRNTIEASRQALPEAKDTIKE